MNYFVISPNKMQFDICIDIYEGMDFFEQPTCTREAWDEVSLGFTRPIADPTSQCIKQFLKIILRFWKLYSNSTRRGGQANPRPFTTSFSTSAGNTWFQTIRSPKRREKEFPASSRSQDVKAASIRSQSSPSRYRIGFLNILL